MTQLISYFEGHGGSVSALAQAENEQSFFSAGEEGLIVRWQLAKPNEGEVILKLPGLISAIEFDVVKCLIYATVNHKGLFVIDAKLRRILKTVELPGTSFNTIGLGANHIVLSTTLEELLILDKLQFAIVHRLKTGIRSFSNFVIDESLLYYAFAKGVEQVDLDHLATSKLLIKEEVTAFCWQKNRLFFCTTTHVFSWDLVKNKMLAKCSMLTSVNINSLRFDLATSTLFAFSNLKWLSSYKMKKKKIIPLKTMHFEHNGEINDILSIENYKFVITAGVNRKIGVWKLP